LGSQAPARVKSVHVHSAPDALNLLAFDTSTELCSVALLVDGRCLTRETMAGNRHSELLLPMIGELLSEAELTLQSLDGIAYGQGPGSFTGLRIGCGVAQGLAFGADLPVLGVITLEAMAFQAGAEKVIACLDARMHEVYYAAYRRLGDRLAIEVAPGVHKPDTVPIPGDESWHGCGSGFRAYPEVMSTRLCDCLASVDTDLWPRAQAMAELALPRFLAGAALPPDQAEPLYVRDKVAMKTSERQQR
jgi:tRNA threonylcarbamoyladenosine biosynthesis protein TsaB